MKCNKVATHFALLVDLGKWTQNFPFSVSFHGSGKKLVLGSIQLKNVTHIKKTSNNKCP